jgi:hypothetical protein
MRRSPRSTRARTINGTSSSTEAGQLDLKASYRDAAHVLHRSRTLFSGIGTCNLTISESFRQGAEDAAGARSARSHPPH